MQDKLERLVRMAFARWKNGQPRASVHPDEETFSLAMQGKLTHGEQAAFEEHLAACDACAEMAGIFLRAAQEETVDVPAETLARAQAAASGTSRPAADGFELVIRLKDAVLELVRSSGDVLVGQEYIPAAVLRAREKAEFTGMLTVVKDCAAFRCRIGIERAAGNTVRLSVSASDRSGGAALNDVRFTLSAGSVELESRLAEKGSLVFEMVPAGVYTVTVEDSAGHSAAIHLETLV